MPIRHRLRNKILAAEKTSDIVFFCSLLVFIGIIGSITTDMYIPSMPIIASSFHTSSLAVKFTITLYLASYAAGMLFYGPIADSFGRKPTLIIATLIGIMGCLFCTFADTIQILYIGRLLQGAGFSAISLSMPALARDVLNNKQFAQTGSILSLAFGLGPILSPVIGSYIAHLLGWRAIFAATTLYSIIILLILLFIMPETLHISKRRVFHIKPILKTYKCILSNTVFIKNVLCKSVSFAGFIVFYTATPFLFQNHLGLTPIQYGWITLTLTGATLISKFINSIILRYVSLNHIIMSAVIILNLSSLLLLGLALLQYYSTAAAVIPFALFGFGSGFLFSNTTVAAFQPFKGSAAASVSGLISGIQLLSGFIGSAIAAHINLSTLLPLGIFMSVISILCMIQYIYFNYQQPSSDQQG